MFWYKMLNRIVARLPKKLVYVCGMRIGAYATGGAYDFTVIPKLTFHTAMDRWEKTAWPKRARPRHVIGTDDKKGGYGIWFGPVIDEDIALHQTGKSNNDCILEITMTGRHQLNWRWRDGIGWVRNIDTTLMSYQTGRVTTKKGNLKEVEREDK